LSRNEIEQRAIGASYRYLAGQNSLAGTKVENCFRVARVELDELGMAHVRMDQVVKGLRVHNQQVITHVDRDGEVQSLTGNYRKELLASRINPKPNILKEGAISRARKNFQGKISSPPKTELLIYPTSRGLRVAHRVEFFGETNNGPARMEYFIDARNGRVLSKQNILAVTQNGGIVPSLAAPNPAFFKPLDLNLRVKSENTNFVEKSRQRSMSY
jgi:Zn-dependent metalloprotease